MHQPLYFCKCTNRSLSHTKAYVHKCLYTKWNIALTKFKESMSHFFLCFTALSLAQVCAQGAVSNMYIKQPQQRKVSLSSCHSYQLTKPTYLRLLHYFCKCFISDTLMHAWYIFKWDSMGLLDTYLMRFYAYGSLRMGTDRITWVWWSNDCDVSMSFDHKKSIGHRTKKKSKTLMT